MFGQSSPPPDVLTWLADNITTFVLLVVIVWGAIKEWWVPGATHRRVIAERDQLLNLAIRGAQVAQKSVEAAEVIVTKVEDG